MSRHKIDTEYYTWIVGWDQPLMTFFLQRFDKGDAENNTPDIWLGGTAETKMYEVEDVVRAGAKHGLTIPYSMEVILYGNKDDGV